MIPVLSRAQIRALDRHAIERCGVPGIVLMENAGRGATDAIERWVTARRPGGLAGLRAVIVAGRGNNGGDGFVVARHLSLRGASVRVLLTASTAALTGDAALAAAAFVGTGGELDEEVDADAVRRAMAPADLVVDAVFGTGLDRDLVGPAAAVVRELAAATAPVVALDLPSGLDADLGTVRGVSARAALTVTFAHPKPGLFAAAALERVGERVTVDIGIPGSLAAEVGAAAGLLEPSDLRRLVAPRPPGAHKGSAGRVLLCAGAPGTLGAALLAARGAARTGAGLVTLAALPEAARALDQRVLEAMTVPLEAEELVASVERATARVDAVGVGPGLGQSVAAATLVATLVRSYSGPLVIDADAITLLARDPSPLAQAQGPRLLTPHSAELGRLLGLSAAEVEADRFGAVRRAADQTGAVVLLKGPFTLVAAPGEPPSVNPTGNAVLATGGAGDVLTGVATALAVQLPLRDAARAAAYLHGLAADRWSARTGADRGMLASEIADELPGALAALAAGRPAVTV